MPKADDVLDSGQEFSFPDQVLKREGLWCFLEQIAVPLHEAPANEASVQRVVLGVAEVGLGVAFGDQRIDEFDLIPGFFGPHAKEQVVDAGGFYADGDGVLGRRNRVSGCLLIFFNLLKKASNAGVGVCVFFDLCGIIKTGVEGVFGHVHADKMCEGHIFLGLMVNKKDKRERREEREKRQAVAVSQDKPGQVRVICGTA